MFEDIKKNLNFQPRGEYTSGFALYYELELLVHQASDGDVAEELTKAACSSLAKADVILHDAIFYNKILDMQDKAPEYLDRIRASHPDEETKKKIENLIKPPQTRPGMR